MLRLYQKIENQIEETAGVYGVLDDVCIMWSSPLSVNPVYKVFMF